MESNLSKAKLAAAFKEIGNDFIQLHDEQGLDESNVNMISAILEDKAGNRVQDLERDIYSCDTVACVGGWAVVLYKDGNPKFNFDNGADVIAEKLGFFDMYEIKEWADDNPWLWGNRYGSRLFESAISYGCNERTITLKKVGEHFVSVGERVAAQ